MKRSVNAGFTLIELITVIILIGILSAAAAPKFVSLSKDAKVSSLQAIAASMSTAADHSYLKAEIYGVAKDSRSSADTDINISFNGGILELKYGYPEARADEDQGVDIIDLIDVSSEFDVCYSTGCTSGNSSHVKVGYDTEHNTGCYVHYIEPGGTGNSDETKYVVNIVDIGC